MFCLVSEMYEVKSLVALATERVLLKTTGAEFLQVSRRLILWEESRLFVVRYRFMGICNLIHMMEACLSICNAASQRAAIRTSVYVIFMSGSCTFHGRAWSGVLSA